MFGRAESCPADIKKEETAASLLFFYVSGCMKLYLLKPVTYNTF